MKIWLSLEAGCLLLGGLVILLMPHVPATPVEMHPLVPQAWVDRMSFVYLGVLLLIIAARFGWALYDSEPRQFRRRVKKILKAQGITGEWRGTRLVAQDATETQARAVIHQLRQEGWL